MEEGVNWTCRPEFARKQLKSFDRERRPGEVVVLSQPRVYRCFRAAPRECHMRMKRFEIGLNAAGQHSVIHALTKLMKARMSA